MDAKIVRRPTAAELDAMVSTAFPAWRGYRTTMLKGGLFNTTYRLERTDDAEACAYILRVGPVNRALLMPYEENLMQAEAWVYEKLAEAGIPSSTVVWLDTSKTLLDRDFMIVRCIESVGLYASAYTDEQKYNIFREVGMYTRQMAEIHTPQFGRVAHILRGEGSPTWSAYIKRELSEWAESIRRNARPYYTDAELDETIALADKFRDILNEITTPCLNHCDLWSLNVLVPKEGDPRVLAIIDPDRACMGDPDFELASGWMMNDAFYDGYGRRINEDDPHTKIRVTLYRMLFHILNGYFMWTEYENKDGAKGDKEWGDRYKEELLAL